MNQRSQGNKSCSQGKGSSTSARFTRYFMTTTCRSRRPRVSSGRTGMHCTFRVGPELLSGETKPSKPMAGQASHNNHAPVDNPVIDGKPTLIAGSIVDEKSALVSKATFLLYRACPSCEPHPYWWVYCHLLLVCLVVQVADFHHLIYAKLDWDINHFGWYETSSFVAP